MDTTLASQAKGYVYQPLPTGFIRLLSVEPDPGNAIPNTIICSLSLVDTTKNPIYHCLSYTWGSPFSSIGWDPAQTVSPGQVICDGCRVQVTANLFAALTTLRNQAPDQLRCIWIDALCINQGDISERSDQVARMGSIYSCAVSVIVWLGPHDDYVPVALDTIRLIKSEHEDVLQELHKIEGDGIYPESQISSLLTSVSAHQWVQSSHLFRRSWFTRIWIIQEVVLANSIKVYCGKYKFSWDDLNLLSISTRVVGSHSLADSFLSPHAPDRDLNAAVLREIRSRIYNISTLVELRDRWSHDRNIDHTIIEWYILRNSRGAFLCTEPRDYIYGLYGLLGNDGNMRPDYTKSVAEVFADLVGGLIRKYKSVDILGFVEDASLRRLKDLPSWVPDLSSALTPGPISEYRAGKSLRRQNHLSLDADNPTAEAGILSITALCLGSIDKTGWASEDPQRSLTKAGGVLRLLQFLADLPVLYHNGEERISVFKRLLQSRRGYEEQNSLDMILATMVVKALVDPKREVNTGVFEQLVKSLHEHDTAGSTPSWEQVDHLIESYLDILRIEKDEEWRTAMSQHPVSSGDFELSTACTNVFYTSTNHLGIGHLSIQEGDHLWIAPSSQTPLILRQLPNGNHHFVGEAYVHGIMHGEVDGAGQRLETIRIE